MRPRVTRKIGADVEHGAMTNWSWERLAAAAGIGTVVLFIVGFIVVGDGPDIDEPLREIVTYYDDKRGNLVVAAILFGLGAVMLMWFLGALATTLREVGQAALSATAFAGGLLVAGVLFVILISVAGAMLTTQEGGSAGAIQALNELSWSCQVVISWPVAVVVGATAAAAARSLVFPRWYALGSGVATVLFLLGGTTWAKDGFWAPDGPYGTITFLLFLVWLALTSVLLMRRPQAADAPLAARAAT